MCHRLRNKELFGGFTLVELMVVVAMLALLSLAIMVKFGDMTKKAKEAQAKANMGRMEVGLDTYRAEAARLTPLEYITGNGPNSETDGDVLIPALITYAIAEGGLPLENPLATILFGSAAGNHTVYNDGTTPNYGTGTYGNRIKGSAATWLYNSVNGEIYVNVYATDNNHQPYSAW